MGVFDKFKKDSGQAPQYGTLAPVPAAKTAKYVQTFDDRAIMQEQPPKAAGGPRGGATRGELATQHTLPRPLPSYDAMSHIRADQQTLVPGVPYPKKTDQNAKTHRL